MKVAMLGTSASRAAGGIFEVERRLSQELLSSGHEVGVFAGEDAETRADLPVWAPIQPQIYPVKGPRAFGYCPGMANGLADWGPDVVHLHMLWMYPSLVLSGWTGQNKPGVITLHGMLDAWAIKHSQWKKKIALWLYEQRNLQHASCLHVLSEAEAESARQFGLRNPLAIIPNGVDITVGMPHERPCGGRKILLFLGRLHPKKGLPNLLRAWAATIAERGKDNWLLVIAGWAELGHEEELKKLADDLGLNWAVGGDVAIPEVTSVLFTGPVFGAEKERWLNLCHAFVLPSVSEGLPVAVLEAWAHRKPVLITPMCNLPEGYAVGAALRILPEVSDLTLGLQTLFSLPEGERESMGQRAFQLVQSRFTWSHVAGQMAGVYEWLVHGGRPPSVVSLFSS